MKRSYLVAVFVAVTVLVAGAVSGCGGKGDGGTSSRDGGKTTALEGIWNKTKTTDGSPASGSAIKFVGDVFYTNAADQNATKYRFVLVDDKQVTLTPIVIKDQIEMDDTSKTTTKQYRLDADTLVLESYGTWVRGSEADAKAAETAADDEAAAEECGKTRAAFDRLYELESGGNPSGGAAEQEALKALAGGTYEQLLAQFKKMEAAGVIGSTYSMNFPYSGEHAWGTSCLSGGKYSIVWDGANLVRVECSIHKD